MIDSLLQRIALMVEIAERQKNGGRFGKTAMQKLCYLLQAVFEVNLGYRFKMFTYGPYEPAIMRDLNYAKATGLLTINYDSDSGYDIQPGPGANELEDLRGEIREKLGDRLEKLLQSFGNLNARDLELRASLVYISREHPDIPRNELVDRVHKIKPKYNLSEIKTVTDKVEADGALTFAAV